MENFIFNKIISILKQFFMRYNLVHQTFVRDIIVLGILPGIFFSCINNLSQVSSETNNKSVNQPNFNLPKV